MKLTIDSWRGTAPKFEPRQLADGLAVEALNARSGRSLLEAWGVDTSTGETIPASARYWFRYLDTYWFTWTDRTEAVLAPLVNDAEQYICISDESWPSITRADVAVSAAPYPSLRYRLGIPQPAKPVLVVDDNSAERPATPASTDDLDLYTVVYKVAWVDAWGREGPGSLVSSRVNLQEYTVNAVSYMAKQVQLTRPTLPTGQYNWGTGALWRVYRANFTSQGQGLFQFVAEVPITDPSYIDRTPSGDLQEAMVTDEWFGPPDNNTALFPNGPLRHIGAHPSGFMFGHTRREVCFSEPGTTHAWPIRYQQSLKEDIVTCLMSGGDIVVLTKGVPYVFTGVSPESMSPMRIPEPYPCVSQDAAVEVSGTVFYASRNGMVAVQGASAQMVTSAFYRDVEWRALQPETMRFGHYDDKVFIFRSGKRTLVFDPLNQDDGLRELDLDPAVHHTLPGSDDLLYMARNDAGGAVKLFNGDLTAARPLQYTTKEYRTPAPTTFGFCKVVSEHYPLTVTVHARKESGEVVSHQRVVSSNKPFALPGGFRARGWWLSVSATASVAVHHISLAHTLSEFND
ncbi:hypothetical protein HNR62_000285 [Oceanisphaera litoralis]|uniref:hypothetical protein n=1 Tax=Oceanisphaera litoralis TaxID=225144 RepID=UPI00195B12C6|nr:hypothetical protein [Oceanisphaera litoralis]MBM7454456.1 hypothetical protein [Oceanisphaera litoralis]